MTNNDYLSNFTNLIWYAKFISVVNLCNNGAELWKTKTINQEQKFFYVIAKPFHATWPFVRNSAKYLVKHKTLKFEF